MLIIIGICELVKHCRVPSALLWTGVQEPGAQQAVCAPWDHARSSRNAKVAESWNSTELLGTDCFMPACQETSMCVAELCLKLAFMVMCHLVVAGPCGRGLLLLVISNGHRHLTARVSLA